MPRVYKRISETSINSAWVHKMGAIASTKEPNMSDTTSPVTDIKQEATRVLDAANAEGFPLRLLGGLAIYLRCPSAQSQEALLREYKDLDFVTLARWSAKTKALF